jgi:hypothetical protein
MSDETRLRFEVRREHFSVQAHFTHPIFDLFREFPDLVRHLFRSLSPHGLRLSDIKLDSASESLGEVNLRLSWPQLAVARLFLDRVDLVSDYPPFLSLRGGSLIPDLLSAVAGHSSDVAYRAFGITQEFHGVLDSSPKDFLGRFSSAVPMTLGPALGTGTVFYFGASKDRLAGSLALDFSRLVEDGLFVKLVVLYDANRLDAVELVETARSQFANLLSEIGLELAGGQT